MIKESLQKLIDGNDLTEEDSGEVMKEIMSGKTTNAQTAAFLTALRMKGETVEEISAFAKVLRDHGCQIRPKVEGRLVDTCGTGGDRIKTFNVSTAAAFVVAGAGVAIAKHGNRSVTSRSGSADVLEHFGLNLKMEPEAVKRTIEQIGIGFMFAPAFHPAMKYAAEPRREMGIRTVFNILGPLINPACADAQLLGVYSHSLVITMAQVLRNLGCKEAMIVHGLDGLDEVSTVGKTALARLKDGEISTMELCPRDFGVKQARAEDIAGGVAAENAEVIFKILRGCCPEDDPKTEIVLANSAAGIIVGGKADSFAEGMALARESVDDGSAYKKLISLIEISGGDVSKIEELESKYG